MGMSFNNLHHNLKYHKNFVKKKYRFYIDDSWNKTSERGILLLKNSKFAGKIK